MCFFRAGNRIIHRCFLIDSNEKDGTESTADVPEGGIELHMLPGRRIVLGPKEADDYRREMKKVLPPREGKEGRKGKGSSGKSGTPKANRGNANPSG